MTYLILALAAIAAGMAVEHRRRFGTRWERRNSVKLARMVCAGGCAGHRALVDTAQTVDVADLRWPE